MSVYESSITNPKKQLEFYKVLSEQLQQENQQLKDRINKAIEYINKLENYPMLTRYNCLEVLKILKGEENE